MTPIGQWKRLDRVMVECTCFDSRGCVAAKTTLQEYGGIGSERFVTMELYSTRLQYALLAYMLSYKES